MTVMTISNLILKVVNLLTYNSVLLHWVGSNYSYRTKVFRFIHCVLSQFPNCIWTCVLHVTRASGIRPNSRSLTTWKKFVITVV